MKKLFISSIFAISCLIALGQFNWNVKAPFPGTARHHPVTFSLDGNGYVLAGSAGVRRGAQESFVKDFYKYDPNSDSWTKMADFPGAARGFSYAVTHNGKAYVGFGQSITNQMLNDLWEYDPVSNSWIQLTSCLCVGRTHPAFIATDNGKLFVGTGGGPTGNLNDWYEYNISTDTWFRHANLPSVTRHHPYFFGIGTDAYVGMGHGPTFVPGFRKTSANIYNDFYKFNTLDSTWTKLSDFPAEGRVAGSQFNHGKYGYIISGQDEDHANFDSGYFYQYTPDLDSWTQQKSHPGTGSRWAPGTFIIDGVVYIVGGMDGSLAYVNQMLAFDLSDIEEEKIDPTVGVISFSDSEEFQMFPNPANDKLNFRVQLDVETSISLYDLKGELVLNKVINNADPNIVISHLEAGMYIVQVESDGIVSRKRLIKQ